jgi:ABC-2 type transport system ATP-binding protein
MMTASTLTPTPELEVESVSYRYGPKEVLKAVSFAVHRGQCHILLGPNGAGKTTLFSLITHLFDCPEGTIRIGGFSLKERPNQALARLGVVFQQSTLDLDLTVRQNLLYHASLHGLSTKSAEARIQTELERLNLWDRLNDKVRALNGGHRRRVEIARALLHEPKLLLLDEPTVGLDVPSRTALVEYVHTLAREAQIAVLWTTHLIDEIQEDDRLIVLDQGALRAIGSVQEILSGTKTDTLGAAFSVLTRTGGSSL